MGSTSGIGVGASAFCRLGFDLQRKDVRLHPHCECRVVQVVPVIRSPDNLGTDALSHNHRFRNERARKNRDGKSLARAPRAGDPDRMFGRLEERLILRFGAPSQSKRAYLRLETGHVSAGFC